MFESFGFETLTPQQASVWFALALGLTFGVLAALTRFCFRRALIGDDTREARGVWALALATAVLGTQAAASTGLIDFADHRYLTGDIPVLAIAVGGLLFGAGMVLTRGCVSRLVVLTGSGNLRAILVLAVFAVVAHATLKGVLAPLRTSLATVTWSVGDYGTLTALPGGALVWPLVIAAIALAFVLRSGNRVGTMILAAALGLLVPLGWVGTGFILYDEFDPIALESLSFIAPVTEGLFWTIAATAVPPGFGTGLIGGAFAGGLIAAFLTRGFEWQSFTNPTQTGRYIAGAALMGFGGALAGGCTIGAGLAGVTTLSLSAVLVLVFIGVGGVAAHHLLNGRTTATAIQPAE